MNIAQDGTFSALLFDGDYKLVRTKGAGPWADVTDSIDVNEHSDSYEVWKKMGSPQNPLTRK